MEGVFEIEKLTLLQTQKQLKRELGETKDDLASAQSNIEQHKKKYIVLKNQFQTFVMQNRPDLTEGQTGKLSESGLKLFIPRIYVRILIEQWDETHKSSAAEILPSKNYIFLLLYFEKYYILHFIKKIKIQK